MRLAAKDAAPFAGREATSSVEEQLKFFDREQPPAGAEPPVVAAEVITTTDTSGNITSALKVASPSFDKWTAPVTSVFIFCWRCL